MYITHHGYTCFKVQSADKITIITDIFDKSIGIKPPSSKADILTFSCDHFDTDITKKIQEDSTPYIINSPGEYEVSGIMIQGITAFHGGKLAEEKFNTTIYKFSIDGITLCHLGDIGQSKLAEEQLDIIGDIDILMIPVGGTYFIDYKDAAHIVNQIEPRVVIPMAYAMSGMKLKLDNLDLFLKEIGLTPREKTDKLKITKSDLPQGETVVIEMKV